MIETVQKKNESVKRQIKELQNMFEVLYANNQISTDEYKALFSRTEKIKNKFMLEERNEESYFIDIENNSLIHSYRLVLGSEITKNEIKNAIRKVELKVRDAGIPNYREYVDFVLEETCKKNKWKVEKFSECQIIEHI